MITSCSVDISFLYLDRQPSLAYSLDVFESHQYLHVHRTKLILIYLIYRNPPDVVVLQLLRYPFLDGDMGQSQTGSQIWVFIGHFYASLTHIQGDGQFLLALPDERLSLGFIWFHLAACKLPQECSPYGPGAGRS